MWSRNCYCCVLPRQKLFSFGHPSIDVVAAKFLQQKPKSNVVKPNNIRDIEGLNK